MAKRARPKAQSKVARGNKRNRQLLETSRCKPHNELAIVTHNLPNGVYVHKCWKCINQPHVTKIGDVLSTSTIDLLRLI